MEVNKKSLKDATEIASLFSALEKEFNKVNNTDKGKIR